jgi:hypothetical protein
MAHGKALIESQTRSMKMSMHVTCWRHDAQHSDNDYDSDPEDDFDQRATYKPSHGPRARVRSSARQAIARNVSASRA